MMLAIGNDDRRIHIPGKHPRKELLEILGANKAERIYHDKKNGEVVHVGYIVNKVWWILYTCWEQPVGIGYKKL